ncbi:unknown [Singapore grouper iridovirus]|uniref:Ig-like domain-containing protein n=1 Tax=Singapore grouper iridovirus TaxID=262968 RepID=Q5YFN4_9VIRU|nr:hypothetical protein ORF031L [Singapore grouper iridovirus]AAS18046.1 unknown [Singapore grouper iridovirus]WAU86740.1 hypothetical protein ORF031L [Singapore grouper iridovirus]
MLFVLLAYALTVAGLQTRTCYIGVPCELHCKFRTLKGLYITWDREHMGKSETLFTYGTHFNTVSTPDVSVSVDTTAFFKHFDALISLTITKEESATYKCFWLLGTHTETITTFVTVKHPVSFIEAEVSRDTVTCVGRSPVAPVEMTWTPETAYAAYKDLRNNQHTTKNTIVLNTHNVSRFTCTATVKQQHRKSLVISSVPVAIDAEGGLNVSCLSNDSDVFWRIDADNVTGARFSDGNCKNRAGVLPGNVLELTRNSCEGSYSCVNTQQTEIFITLVSRKNRESPKSESNSGGTTLIVCLVIIGLFLSAAGMWHRKIRRVLKRPTFRNEPNLSETTEN